MDRGNERSLRELFREMASAEESLAVARELLIDIRGALDDEYESWDDADPETADVRERAQESLYWLKELEGKICDLESETADIADDIENTIGDFEDDRKEIRREGTA